MKLRLLVLKSLLVSAACGGGGGDDGRAAAHGPCPLADLDDADEPVHLSVVWPGGWDTTTTDARIKLFDDAEAGIEVGVGRPGGDSFFAPALTLLGDSPPVLSEVSYSLLPALVGAGAIQTIGECAVDAGVDFDGMVPAAVRKGEVDGKTYGVSTNIDTTVLLYDRAGFARAGLDPDVPPRTLDEVLTFGRALREQGGMERPVAWDAPQLTLVGLDIASDDARAAAELWVTLAAEGLLIGPDDTQGIPPVGSGQAAMQWADPHILWEYASAIDAGQAPDADLAIAPLPGLRGPASGAGGGVWVVSADATAEEVAAAARFLAWYGEPTQESAFHIATDLYPSSLAGAAAAEEYWQQYPLIGAGWDALVADTITLEGWERQLGSFATLIPFLHEVADGVATFDEQWSLIVDTIAALEARQEADPEGLLRCLAEHIEDRRTPVLLCSS